MSSLLGCLHEHEGQSFLWDFLALHSTNIYWAHSVSVLKTELYNLASVPRAYVPWGRQTRSRHLHYYKTGARVKYPKNCRRHLGDYSAHTSLSKTSHTLRNEAWRLCLCYMSQFSSSSLLAQGEYLITDEAIEFYIPRISSFKDTESCDTTIHRALRWEYQKREGRKDEGSCQRSPEGTPFSSVPYFA